MAQTVGEGSGGPQEVEDLEVHVTGRDLLEDPLLNKGSAFPEAERQAFGLLGLLPHHCSSLEEQVIRAYENYSRLPSPLEKYIYLTSLQDRNEVLFYRLVAQHLPEMMPIIYTPTVGLGCQVYSHIFRRPRGLYLAYPYRREISTMLDHSPRQEVAVIVVTDGERILGLGDQGVGGMGIPIGKLSLYTLCAGIHPRTTLPIFLDVGTDNPERLADPLYLGWRHERMRGQAYDDFVESFVEAVIRKFPRVLLQWEDFSKEQAPALLARYRDRLCTFNDDIQGTGAVTLAGLLTATRLLGQRLSDQRIVMLGAGAAATGIGDQLVEAMRQEGTEEAVACRTIWQVDRQGLVHTGRVRLEPNKRRYAQPTSRLADWTPMAERFLLPEVVRRVRPTILIGASAQPGAFTEEIVREMARHVERPVIFPLSNPTPKAEATPVDLVRWTEGRALVATGSPFPAVAGEGTLTGRRFPIGQCNNAFVFPGVGLGVIAVEASRVTQAMFLIAARILSEAAPALRQADGALYPELTESRTISRQVALAVAEEAIRSGLANPLPPAALEARLASRIWVPHYPALRRGEKRG
jgi:malate dehydrogenase (oxaloacetate-decarboxylating)